MPGTHEILIRPSYVQLRSFYLGVDVRNVTGLQPGEVTVTLEGDDEFSVQGRLDPQGFVTGMSKLFARLQLRDGDVVVLSVQTPETDPLIVIHSPLRGGGAPLKGHTTGALVFQTRQLRPVHLEAFRPENLDTWEPQTEGDVYLVFGVLQEFTDFQYCCGTSQAVLDKLGADYSGSAKPDAILIDRSTDEYLMAEFKKSSSHYASNHAPADVDVLVCWLDDGTTREELPRTVLELRSIAKTAAQRALEKE